LVTTRMRLPSDIAAPAEVTALAQELIAILNTHDRAIVGPAVSMLFAFTIFEFGRADDMKALDQILRDVAEIVTRHGAAIPRHAH